MSNPKGQNEELSMDELKTVSGGQRRQPSISKPTTSLVTVSLSTDASQAPDISTNDASISDRSGNQSTCD